MITGKNGLGKGKFNDKSDQVHITKCKSEVTWPQKARSVIPRHKVTIDKSGANKAGLEAINLQLEILLMWTGQFFEIRQIKYLNNIIEQDHRAIKRIVNSMMGFKAFHSAEATLAGIELYHMLRNFPKTSSYPLYRN